MKHKLRKSVYAFIAEWTRPAPAPRPKPSRPWSSIKADLDAAIAARRTQDIGRLDAELYQATQFALFMQRDEGRFNGRVNV